MNWLTQVLRWVRARFATATGSRWRPRSRPPAAFPWILGIAGDSQVGVGAAVIRGLDEADILLTSGGVSMGDLDLIKPLLEHAGTVHFGRIRMKPGKPLTFATASWNGATKLIFGLPGNPVSSLVTFYLMAVPAMRKMAGWPIRT